MVVMIVIASTPNFTRQKRPIRNACIANLKQISGALDQWALEKRKSANDAPVLIEVLDYLKDSKLPVCPSGGKYSLGKTVADPPTCSIPGHSLIENDAASCIWRLKAIQEAKERWAAKNHRPPTDTPTLLELTDGSYLDLSWRGVGYRAANDLTKKWEISCPQGGPYKIGAVGEMPTCSLSASHGHSL